MPSGGAHEAFLTTDYNAEMIEHVERHPGVRDRAIFVGEPEDIVPLSFGKDLPAMRDWVPEALRFRGLYHGRASQRPSAAAPSCARALGYRPDERVCIVTVGGSGVGAHLIRRILQSYADRPRQAAGAAHDRGRRARASIPQSLDAPPGVEVRAFVPDLDRHLAACDLALVQGGLTTCMELTAAGTPFLYFPLQEPFRAELPCRPSPRPLRRRPAHGLRDRDARHDRRGHGRRLARAARPSSRSKPTARRAPPACWPS